MSPRGAGVSSGTMSADGGSACGRGTDTIATGKGSDIASATGGPDPGMSGTSGNEPTSSDTAAPGATAI